MKESDEGREIQNCRLEKNVGSYLPLPYQVLNQYINRLRPLKTGTVSV